MPIDGEKVVLSSGRELSASGGIVGVSPEHEITVGYEDRIWPVPDFGQPQLGPEEVRELADLMIERWQRVKRAARAFSWAAGLSGMLCLWECFR